MKSEKTHVFGFVTSLLFTVFTVGGFSLVLYVKYDIVDLETTIYSGMLLFLASFLVLQQRIKRFIYKRVRKIYEDVSLLETSSFNEDSMTADIETLSIEVQKFATDKQLEIESLNEREAYRREFLGNVSHELKTPLFTVQGYLLTLIEGAANDEEIRNRYLERANIGVERLAEIVKDLDLISKLETNELHLDIKPFNCLEMVQKVFDLFEMKVKKKNITLRFDQLYEFPVYVLGDAAKIEQEVTVEIKAQADAELLWFDLPMIETKERVGLETLKNYANNSELFKNSIIFKTEMPEVKHVLSHQVIYAKFFLVDINLKELKLEEPKGEAGFYSFEEIEALPKPVLIKNALNKFLT